MTENFRLLMLLFGMAICLAAMWPHSPQDVTLSRGAAVSFTFVEPAQMRGGVYWTPKGPKFTYGGNEVAQAYLRAQLTATEWAEVEAFLRNPPPAAMWEFHNDRLPR